LDARAARIAVINGHGKRARALFDQSGCAADARGAVEAVSSHGVADQDGRRLGVGPYLDGGVAARIVEAHETTRHIRLRNKRGDVHPVDGGKVPITIGGAGPDEPIKLGDHQADLLVDRIVRQETGPPRQGLKFKELSSLLW
jgi:hypothetical protein